MKRWTHILLAAALAVSWPVAAIAEETDGEDASAASTASTAVAEEAQPYQILAGETDIEKLTDSFEEARADLETVEAEVEELQVQVDSIEAELPAQQARSDAGLKKRYIMQSNPMMIVEALLSVDTLSDFIKQTDYIEKISQSNLKEYNRLLDMQEQLNQAKAKQEQLRDKADARLAEAESALRAVQDERARKQEEDQAFAVRQAEVQGGPNSIEKAEEEPSATADSKSEKNSKKNGKSSKEDAAAAKKAAEEAAKKAEEEAAKKAAEDAAKGILPPVEATLDTEGLADGADWHADRDVFIGEWAERIDAYLAGSPLEGQGRNFAAAAWKYGIDPRWSPAISNMESSKGTYCIRPFNAWGWGAADSDPYGLALEWGSWEEAIDAHVKGLATGYGYTISMGRARTYCPPNWQRWYNNILRDMASMKQDNSEQESDPSSH